MYKDMCDTPKMGRILFLLLHPSEEVETIFVQIGGISGRLVYMYVGDTTLDRM